MIINQLSSNLSLKDCFYLYVISKDALSFKDITFGNWDGIKLTNNKARYQKFNLELIYA
jgi:hypothetical protein